MISPTILLLVKGPALKAEGAPWTIAINSGRCIHFPMLYLLANSLRQMNFQKASYTFSRVIYGPNCNSYTFQSQKLRDNPKSFSRIFVQQRILIDRFITQEVGIRVSRIMMNPGNLPNNRGNGIKRRESRTIWTLHFQALHTWTTGMLYHSFNFSPILGRVN